MDMATILRQVDAWPLEERIRLLDEVWDRVLEAGGEPELTHAQREELDRRLAALAQHPDEVVTWDEVKAHLRRSR